MNHTQDGFEPVCSHQGRMHLAGITRPNDSGDFAAKPIEGYTGRLLALEKVLVC